MEVLPLLSASVWHIEQMSKLKQYSEVLLVTPKRVILGEVKNTERNCRNKWENNSIKKEEGEIEKERRILRNILLLM
jgi:hypothetical protein